MSKKMKKKFLFLLVCSIRKHFCINATMYIAEMFKLGKINRWAIYLFTLLQCSFWASCTYDSINIELQVVNMV